MARKIIGLLLILMVACTPPDNSADLIIYNAEILLPGNKIEPEINALSVKNGRIEALGNSDNLLKLATDKTIKVDAKGEFLMPGLIEGHGHFSGLGRTLDGLNFLTAKSWDEIVKQVGEKVKTLPPGAWIYGRGWHQEKWETPVSPSVSGYPTSVSLDSISPNNPVLLVHASGHGSFANQAAMDIAGIDNETPNPKGGKIIREAFGKATGVFEENAKQIIHDAYNQYKNKLTEEERMTEWLHWIDLAQKECLKKGITSFQDAGSNFTEIKRYAELAENGKLDLRLWAMLRHSYIEMKDSMDGFPIKDIGKGFFTCNAIKSEVDGALGAHGAWLLKPYEDRTGFIGQNTTSIEEVANIATLATKNKMQLCVHAIGDRANREVLNIMESEYQKSGESDLRWRIEHAQHLSVQDIPRFKDIGVIASIQGIHCTSDAPFVEKRLGEKRSKEGAYPWRSLLDAGVAIANGTDAPVEDVDPLPSLYASVTRKRADNGFPFFTEQSMTRSEALESYTLGNAYAAFQEHEKGTLSIGKFADMVLLSKNLLTCPPEEILQAKVLKTIVAGEIKYDSNLIDPTQKE